MAHRFPVKEIALQAGVGTATVDRVLNGRPGVRRQTANRVLNAIRDLEAQEAQLSMSGRKLIVDLLVEAPLVFLDALQAAVACELPLIQTAIFRVRSDMRARFPVEAILAALDRIARRGTDGVILMAPDTAVIRAAVDRLTADGIPVVTLATDMPGATRTAYVGLDNRGAGETAAWLVHKWTAGPAAPRVIVTKRNAAFRGEHEREDGFRAGLKRHCPEADIRLLVQGREGPDFAERVAHVAAQTPTAALYSIGGGNRALVAALDRAGVRLPAMIVHDLDAENRALLSAGRVDAVLYHDLSEDIRRACQAILSVDSSGTVPMPANGASLRVMLPPMFGQAGGAG